MNSFLYLIEKDIDKAIEKIPSDNPFKDSFAYVLNGGGKRIRPQIYLSTYSIFNDDLTKAISLATSIELVHNYSLVHDDLPAMDDDDYRRGKLSAHKKFGHGQAILIGDALLTYAFSYGLEDILTSEEAYRERKLKALKLLADKAGFNGMIWGQDLDINEGANKDKNIDFLTSRKTGDLIEAAAVMGALVAGAAKPQIDLLRDFGRKLGYYFQLRDDYLDYDEDKLINKETLVSNLDKKEAESLLKTRYNKLNRILDVLDNEKFSIGELRKIIVQLKI